MIKFWDITIPELTDDQERNAYIYVPDSYHRDKNKRYPVLYMFDGHNVFFDSHATYGKSWGMKEYLENTDTELIVAAVECNHSPDNGRLREYSPYDFSDPQFGSFQGLGDITMQWFIHTFKPYIDTHYPTLSDRKHTFIGGSSMGGLMSLYALLEYNHVFSRAAALSPSLWVSRSKVESMIRRAEVDPETVLYMDYGSEEFENHEDMMRQYGKVTALLMSRGVMVDSRIVPGGTHCEASWERQIPFFMNTLLY